MNVGATNRVLVIFLQRIPETEELALAEKPLPCNVKIFKTHWITNFQVRALLIHNSNWNLLACLVVLSLMDKTASSV